MARQLRRALSTIEREFSRNQALVGLGHFLAQLIKYRLAIERPLRFHSEIKVQMNKNQYRPDIDGLRAIAVLSVLLHHLNATLLPGGFIGVDIFFVISGYLITSQVYKEICSGSFSIQQFYKRRINRIIPILITVIFATLIVGVVLLSPSDLIKLGKSAIYAMLGLSNLFFWREYGNYFAGNASEAPLLHTWSLGVEEQFYIIWPLLILTLTKLIQKRIASVLAALIVGSLVVSEAGINIAASASYYMLPTRIFELMIGGLLAIFVAHNQSTSRIYSILSLTMGISIIGVSLFLIDKFSSFPGVNAIWPCLGAALVIWSGTNPQPISWILTNRPMIFIGLISYSLYLWHWPIIAFLSYLNIRISLSIGFFVALSSFTLAYLSWRFIETPMRRTGALLSFLKVFVRRFVMPVIILLLIGLAMVYTGGISTRFDPLVAEFERAVEAKPDVLRSGCHVPTAMYKTPPNNKCRLGMEKTELDGILIGDSFANHFSGMVDLMAKAEDRAFIDYTMDGCPPILGYDTGKASAYAERCRKRNEATYAMIANSSYERVILAGNWPKDRKAGEQLIMSIETILKTGSKLTVIIANEGIDRATSCPIRQLMYNISEHCEYPRNGPPTYFDEIESRFPNVHLLDPNRVICRSNFCNPVLDSTLLYRDDAHLNDVGARLIGEYLIKMGEKI